MLSPSSEVRRWARWLDVYFPGPERDVTGVISLPKGVDMVRPGENMQIVVELVAPIIMEVGRPFAIREGDRTVGAGVVTRILG